MIVELTASSGAGSGIGLRMTAETAADRAILTMLTDTRVPGAIVALGSTYDCDAHAVTEIIIGKMFTSAEPEKKHPEAIRQPKRAPRAA